MKGALEKSLRVGWYRLVLLWNSIPSKTSKALAALRSKLGPHTIPGMFPGHHGNSLGLTGDAVVLPLVKLRRAAMTPDDRKAWAVTPQIARVDRVALSQQRDLVFPYRAQSERRKGSIVHASAETKEDCRRETELQGVFRTGGSKESAGDS